jgi:hypothetical protein
MWSLAQALWPPAMSFGFPISIDYSTSLPLINIYEIFAIRLFGGLPYTGSLG